MDYRAHRLSRTCGMNRERQNQEDAPPMVRLVGEEVVTDRRSEPAKTEPVSLEWLRGKLWWLIELYDTSEDAKDYADTALDLAIDLVRFIDEGRISLPNSGNARVSIDLVRASVMAVLVVDDEVPPGCARKEDFNAGVHECIDAIDRLEAEATPDGSPDLAKAERDAIVKWLHGRSAWLRREARAGGAEVLRDYATEVDAVADLVARGRHHQEDRYLT